MKCKGVSVSHTTVDKWVVEDKAVGGALFKQLCHNGRKRSPYKGVSACNIPTRTSIKDRPAEVYGKRFGDWKMNLIIGKNGCQAILVLVERSTSYVILNSATVSINRLSDSKLSLWCLGALFDCCISRDKPFHPLTPPSDLRQYAVENRQEIRISQSLY